MTKNKWTTEQEYFLKLHYAEGKGLSYCAESLGLTINAVKKKAARLGVAGDRRNFTDSEVEYIKANYAEMGPREVARVLGVNWQSVNTLVQKRLHLHCNPGVRGKISSRTNREWQRTEETKRKIGAKTKARVQGAGNPRWKGGVSPLRSIVTRKLWPVWILPILVRDNFTCRSCGTTEKTMDVHHLRRYKDIRDLIIERNPHLSISVNEEREQIATLIVLEHRMEDGEVLCRACHRSIHFAKRGELRETLTTTGEGNPQPSRSNVLNFVERKVQRLTGEDAQSNKPDTSAPHLHQEMMR